ncbi:hypothetical protein [Lichenifustis flavocetrariae]|uniref:Uncharacterized protein n=1 Tax=Lichenifustis flavocetrariae TaxID=2949735 RepID=A0AA42CNZ2_9HYPH|nr:hypothetical protein [Lichenifustis flavocetrariae]MCW6509890.1 hypothetical protein [Lichenifustis flavocetrariae]
MPDPIIQKALGPICVEGAFGERCANPNPPLARRSSQAMSGGGFTPPPLFP